jgi:asparagine synthase (glutamine-hydrolysing)
MNPRQHALYLGSNYRRFGDLQGETYFQHLRRLPFAGRLRHDSHGLRVDQYWDLALTNLAHVAPADLGADYVAKLGESVRRRLATCRNPAFTISSGMDSSSVVCLAVEQLGRQVPLYTTTYREETDYNEADDIAVMARQFGSQWHQVLVTGDTILETLRTCLADADEPYATVTQLMHDYLARQARADGYDALFSGLGGDEANAGEIEEYLFFFADLQARGETAARRAHMVGWHAYHDHPLYPKTEAVLQRFFAQQIDFVRPGHNLPNPAYHQSYRAALRAPPELPPPFMPHPYRSYLRNKLYQDLFYETIPPVLKAETANSRRAGLPTLYPYLDPAVMTTGFSIPLALKYDRGISKALLRQAMRGRLPDAVLDNCRKRGWNAPFNLWVTQSLTPLVEDFIHRPTDRQRDLYDTAAIARYWHEHRAGQHNHMMFFWQLINYELWHAQQA